MAEQKKIDPRTVQLRRVRLSFADGLVEQTASVEGGRLRFNANLLIECVGNDEKAVAHSADNKAKCLGAIEVACEQQWGKRDKWKSIQEDAPKRLAFRKGERFKKDDEVYKGYAGNFAISAAGPGAGKSRPTFFDRHRQKLDPRDPKYLEYIASMFYSGCYVDAFVSFYGGDEGGAGVFASIDSLRTHMEGERTAGGGYQASTDDWDAFEDEDDDAPAASASGDDFGLG